MASGEGGHAPPVVSLTSKEMVAPATPTSRHHYFLSCFDIFWKVFHYNQRVLFYGGTDLCGQGVDGRGVLLERLKSGLARCLVHYYPQAGRLSRPPAVHRLSVDCNDAGVEFAEASCPLPMALLSSQGFQLKPFFEHLCPKVDHSGDCLYSSPLLSVQATFFSDGGLALGITQSHVVADGQALWNFMVSWGECARGLPLSKPPVLDREQLALPNPSPEKATWDLKLEVREEDIEGEHTEVPSQNSREGVRTDSALEDSKEAVRAGAHGDSAGTPATSEEALISFVFNLSASAVKSLKKQDGGVHTSYEVIGAHLWQRLTVARQRPSREPTMFFILANCRARMKPPLPPTYFGNAISFGVAISCSGKICNENLHAMASRIHAAIVETTQEESLTSIMHWLEIHDHDFGDAYSKMPEGKNVNVASSPWFPVYEVDFGWGKPVAVRSSKVPGDGELVFFGGHPNATQGDVEVCTSLPKDVLRRLLKDPLFLGQLPSDPFD